MYLETERAYITFLKETDIDELVEMCLEKDSFKYVTPLRDKSKEEYKEFITSKLEVNAKFKVKGYWVVRSKENDDIIGTLNYYPLPESSGYTFSHIGAHFKRKYWGQGYSKELLSRLITYIHEELNETEILALVDSDHTVSKKMLARLGFAFSKFLPLRDEVVEMHALRLSE